MMPLKNLLSSKYVTLSLHKVKSSITQEITVKLAWILVKENCRYEQYLWCSWILRSREKCKISSLIAFLQYRNNTRYTGSWVVNGMIFIMYCALHEESSASFSWIPQFNSCHLEGAYWVQCHNRTSCKNINNTYK